MTSVELNVARKASLDNLLCINTIESLFNTCFFNFNFNFFRIMGDHHGIKKQNGLILCLLSDPSRSLQTPSALNSLPPPHPTGDVINDFTAFLLSLLIA